MGTIATLSATTITSFAPVSSSGSGSGESPDVQGGRITEDGDPRITEDGEQRITEAG